MLAAHCIGSPPPKARLRMTTSIIHLVFRPGFRICGMIRLNGQETVQFRSDLPLL